MVQFHTGNKPKITPSQSLEKKYWLEFWKLHFAKQTLLWDLRNSLFLLRLGKKEAHKLSLTGNFYTWQKGRLYKSGDLYAWAYPREYNHLQYFSPDLVIMPSYWFLGSKLHRTPSWVISVPKLASRCCCLFYQTSSPILLLHACYLKLLRVIRQFRDFVYCLDYFLPFFRIGLCPRHQNHPFLLGVLSVNLVQPNDPWWQMPLLQNESSSDGWLTCSRCTTLWDEKHAPCCRFHRAWVLCWT